MVFATVCDKYEGKQRTRRQYGENHAIFYRSSILVARQSGLMYLISLVNVGDFVANDIRMVQRLEKPSDEDELQPKDGGNIAYEDDMAGVSMYIDSQNDDLDVSVHALSPAVSGLATFMCNEWVKQRPNTRLGGKTSFNRHHWQILCISYAFYRPSASPP